VAEEEELLHEQFQQQQLSYDEEIVARRNTEVMGVIDAALGIG